MLLYNSSSACLFSIYTLDVRSDDATATIAGGVVGGLVGVAVIVIVIVIIIKNKKESSKYNGKAIYLSVCTTLT